MHIYAHRHTYATPQSKQEIKVVVKSTSSPASTAYVFLSSSVILIISLLVLVLLKCLQCIRNVRMNHGSNHYRRSTTGMGGRNFKKQQPLLPHSLIT